MMRKLFSFRQFMVFSLLGGLMWFVWLWVIGGWPTSWIDGAMAVVSGLIVTAIVLGLSMWLFNSVKWLRRG